MHLPHGCRILSGRAESIKELSRLFLKVLFECAHHQRIRKRGCAILRHGKLLLVGPRQQIFVHAQHLRHFQGAAFKLAEGLINIGGVVLM